MNKLKAYLKSGAILIFTLAIVLTTSASGLCQIKIGGMTISFPEKAKVRKPDKPVVKEGNSYPGTVGTDQVPKNAVSKVEQDHPGLVYELEKIEKMRVAIDKYSSEWPYWPENTYKNFTLFAVSKRERENYLKGVEGALQTGPHRAKLHAALDALAASAAKKLPIYKPSAQTFSVRSPANEKMILQKLKERLGNTASLTIHKSGFQSNWQIYKDSIGLPQYRFMRGYIYAKNTADDHPYCHLYYVSVNQDYAGGGTYGSSAARFEDDLVFGLSIKVLNEWSSRTAMIVLYFNIKWRSRCSRKIGI